MESDPMQELIEAARPFAEACAHLHPALPDDGETLDGFKVRDFRRIAAALSNAETHLPDLKAAGGWRPIESAPKDGTWVLLWCDFTDAAEAIVARWVDSPAPAGPFGKFSWCHAQDGKIAERVPTHWMPLPPAPGSLALGAVPEGGEERGSSRTDPSATPSGRPETPSPAGFQVHVLKTHPVPFAAVRARVKKLEIRRADRDFKAGDTLWLDEYDPETDTKSGEVEIRVITHVLPGGQYGIERGYVALSIDDAPLHSAPPRSPSANGASAGSSGLDEPLPPALPYSAASRP